MKSFDKPTSELVDAAVPKISSPQHERYFFDRLENPHWIEPLSQRGLFLHPPSPEEVDGGGVRTRTWPQSRYLARMASLAPGTVAGILVEIRTDNWTIVADIVEAAKAMPAADAARLARMIGDHVGRLGLWHLLDDVGTIVARLSEDGEATSALDLFERAFAIDRRRSSRRIRRDDDYGYFEGLRDYAVPSLARVRGEKLVRALLRWLTAAMEAEDGRRAGGDDFSYVWRPAIEDHEQNRDYDFAAKLVGCVRDACELAVREGGVPLATVLAMLQDHSLIRRRLRLHLINEFAAADQALARATMLDRSIFQDYGCKHEYARLVEQRFTLLDDDQRAQWLGWIDEGPDTNEVDEAAAPEVLASQRRYWQFRRLHWVRDHLSGSRKDFYDQMHAEHGEPQLADLNVSSGDARWGHESAYSAEQLAELGFEKAVETVCKWRLGPGESRFDGPSVEGLKQSFRQYVATDPEGFSSHATLLRDKPACYVRSFLESLVTGVKGGKMIDLDAVLDLCTWVVDQPLDENTSPATEDERLVDRDWQWCRDTVAELMQEVCKAKDGAKQPCYTLDYHDAIWSVISRLPDVPARTYVVRDEAEDDPRVADWPLIALNSPRGKAMHAVFAYADWIADHRVPSRAEHRALPGGFGGMEEVRAMLETQLARLDKHFTERAVFGWRLGLLYWIDAEWLRAHADQIFDLRVFEATPSQAFGWAAWNTFLFSHRPHVEFYRILKDQFSYAVDQAVALTQPQDSREQPFARLGEHLLVLYGRGDLGDAPEDAWHADDAIIRRLVTEAHPSVRSHAVEFVGQSLQGHPGHLPEPVSRRFRYLWEQYWQAVGEADATGDPTSRAFGYWFSSGAFAADWSLQQLELFVTAAPKADPDHMIVERLAAIADADPVRCARIVGALVDGDDEGWRVPSWKDDAKKVLQTAIATGGEARAQAEQVIDRLGRRGLLEFGELLAASNASRG